MSSTYAYTALSPDYADLRQSRQDGPDETHTTAVEPRYSSLSISEDEYEARGRFAKIYVLWRKATDLYRRNVGLLLVIASQAFFSLMNLAVKKLNSIDPPVSALELVVVRMGITWICSVTYMLSTGVPDPFVGPKGIRILLVLRGLFGFISLFGIYFSLQYLTLSDATVLTFLAPLCTGIAGSLFLREKFTRKEVFAGLLSLVGVVLIARPPILFGKGVEDALPELPSMGDASTTYDSPVKKVSSEQRLIAVGVALVGVMSSSGAYTTLTAIGKKAHPLHSLTSFSTQSVIGASVGMLATRTEFIVPTRLDWLAMLVMIGIFGFIAQVLLTMGLARETAGRGSMAIYTQIVFATILERIFFHSAPSVLSVIGTLVILSSALYVALTKETSAKPKGRDAKHSITLRTADDDALERGLLESVNDDGESAKGPEPSSSMSARQNIAFDSKRIPNDRLGARKIEG